VEQNDRIAIEFHKTPNPGPLVASLQNNASWDHMTPVLRGFENIESLKKAFDAWESFLGGIRERNLKKLIKLENNEKMPEMRIQSFL